MLFVHSDGRICGKQHAPKSLLMEFGDITTLQPCNSCNHWPTAAQLKVTIHFAAICTNPLYLEPMSFQIAHVVTRALLWWKSWFIGYHKSINCYMSGFGSCNRTLAYTCLFYGSHINKRNYKCVCYRIRTCSYEECKQFW